MSYVISAAIGSFTSSLVWDTAESTSLLDSEVGNTALTTSYVLSSTFTPGAVIIDSLLLKIASVAGGTGTITVALDSSGDVSGTIVTTNISNLPLCTTATNEGGWYAFKFSSPKTLSAATAYSVKVKVSAGASTVNLYRDGTAGNWSRLLRQSTINAAPTSGDTVIIVGDDTGSATTSYTVTMNNTDAGASTFAGLSLSTRGVLSYGTSASTSYYLKISGITNALGLIVYSNGSLNIGTSGTPMPSTSTAVLEFACTSDGQYGLTIRNGGTFNAYGASIGTTQTYLNADSHNSDTSLTVLSTSGWQTGDQIVLASTTRTPGDTELRTISSVTDSTHVVVDALTGPNTSFGTINTVVVGNINHQGSLTAGNPFNVQAEVAHLTRNVKIRSSSSSFATGVNLKASALCTLSYIEFYNIGANITGRKSIEVETTSGSFSIDHCSIHDTRAFGLFVSTASGSISATNCNFYNCDTTNTNTVFSIAATSGSHTIISNWIFVAPQYGFGLSDIGSTITNNVAVTTGNGFGFFEPNGFQGIFSGNVGHSCGQLGFITGQSSVCFFVSCIAYRNASAGYEPSVSTDKTTLTSCRLFGNPINITQAAAYASLTLINCTLDGDFTFATTSGLVNNTSTGPVSLINSTFGSTRLHTTADITFTNNIFARVTAWNCLFASTTKVSNITASLAGSGVWSADDGQVSGASKLTTVYGTIVNDQTTVHTLGGTSWKITPNNATNNLIFPGPLRYDSFKTPVAGTSSVQVSCWIRYDSSYGSTMPKLTVLGGLVQGVPFDVSSTAISGMANIWQQLVVSVTPTESTTLEFIIDNIVGTSGSVFVDDIFVTGN